MRPTDTRTQFYDIWSVYWPIALAVFLTVLALVVFFVLRYRSRSREIPSGRDESQPLEIGYAIGLACIAAFLVALTFSRMPGKADSAATGKPVAIKVTGARWDWRFEYPEFGIVEQGGSHHIPVLRVPVDTEIEFAGRSLDVIHSFWIPEEKFKRDVFPTFVNRWEMVFGTVETDPGGGACAELCGLEHWHMIFNVVAMPRARFARWARGAAAAAGRGGGESVEAEAAASGRGAAGAAT